MTFRIGSTRPGDTESSSTPIFRNSFLSNSDPRPIRRRYLPRCPRRAHFDNHADHRQHRRMVRIVKCIQLRILTVNCQRILGSGRSFRCCKKSTFFRQFPAYHDCRRVSIIMPCFGSPNWRFCAVSSVLNLLDNLRNRLDLPDTRDHRIHDLEIAIGTCPKQRAKLCLENSPVLSGRYGSPGSPSPDFPLFCSSK